MKVALIALGTRGDVHPMLSLATALAAAGHEARLLAPPDFAAEANAAGVPFTAVGESVRDYLGGAAAALHGGMLALTREMQRWSERSLAHELATLPAATAGADYVLAAGTSFLAASVAEAHRVPFRYVAYVPSLLPSSAHTPAMFPFQIRSQLLNRVLWRAASAAMNAMMLRTVNGCRGQLGLGPVRDLVRHVLSRRPLVAVDRLLAAMPADCPVPHQQIRCLHPFDAEALPDDVERFLAAGAPPIYLGFGSMTDPDPRRTTLDILGAITRLGCRAIISSGWAGLGEADLPEGVTAIGPVSHASLFPRCRVVVHHGGAGTTHTASRAGVPQIVVPHVLDQFFYARCAEAAGVAGRTVPRAKLDVSRLAAAVRDAIEDQGLSARAADLARRLADLGPVWPEPNCVLADASC